LIRQYEYSYSSSLNLTFSLPHQTRPECDLTKLPIRRQSDNADPATDLIYTIHNFMAYINLALSYNIARVEKGYGQMKRLRMNECAWRSDVT
jgi:hypothetical protein